ncbi:MAG: HlyD family type I secretion periplasmic adaptor subunit [Burkholderiales bacterium]
MKSDASEFAPDILKLQEEPPSPLSRFVLFLVLSLLAALFAWAFYGHLDIIAIAEGKLVPKTYLKIVQPSESGIVKDILVREGQKVQAGQVLMRMDMTLSQADSRTLQSELKQRELQLRRVDAELTSKVLKQTANDPAELFAPVLAQYQARVDAYHDSIQQEQAVLKKARDDLDAALATQEKLTQTLPHFQEQEQAYQKLVKDGVVSRLMASEKTRDRVEKEQDLAAQIHSVAGLKAAVSQSEKRLNQIASAYRKELQNERVEALGTQQKLQQEWQKQQHRHQLLELKAAQAGIVKDLATHTPGTVVSPGTILMTLVPQDEALAAEVWVDNKDVGFVHAGQEVKVKLSAFPFQKYGMVEGKVLQVSADSSERSNSEQGKATPLAYRALVELREQTLESNDHRYSLAPGMQIAAEIHLGERTVMEYLLSPVQKAFHEAGRER